LDDRKEKFGKGECLSTKTRAYWRVFPFEKGGTRGI